MKKKVVLTSSVILLSLLICFAVVYGLMIAFCSSAEDYSDMIIGKWNCVQYYIDGQSFVCDDDHWAELDISEDYIDDRNSIFDFDISGKYDMVSGTIGSLKQGTPIKLIFEFNSRGQLKINYKELNLILVLSHLEEE